MQEKKFIEIAFEWNSQSRVCFCFMLVLIPTLRLIITRLQSIHSSQKSENLRIAKLQTMKLLTKKKSDVQSSMNFTYLPPENIHALYCWMAAALYVELHHTTAKPAQISKTDNQPSQNQ